jgi:hypothetical protein
MNVLHDIRLNRIHSMASQTFAIFVDPGVVGIFFEMIEEKEQSADRPAGCEADGNMIEPIIAIACFHGCTKTGAEQRHRKLREKREVCMQDDPADRTKWNDDGMRKRNTLADLFVGRQQDKRSIADREKNPFCTRMIFHFDRNDRFRGPAGAEIKC